MLQKRIIALLVILAAAAVGYFVYVTEVSSDPATSPTATTTTASATTTPGKSPFAFKFGLDLNGGSHLVYQADIASLASTDVPGAMEALRDVIERRVNLFGVSEPLVQVESGGVVSGTAIQQKLIVELPGVTDIDEAIAMIGKTPLLEFRLATQLPPAAGTTTPTVNFSDTGLTGRYLQNSSLEFNQTTMEPVVSLTFNTEGKALFAKITKENVGKILGIFLDGEPISLPVIREEISDGQAQISGNFNANDAKLLVRNLNYGALPVPITLISTQTVGATLGADAVKAGQTAGIISFIVIAIFLLLWYRLPGLVAIIALAVYVAINLALFKLIPVTLTAAGIAGFILSLGMAVDANILIFERMKEELRRGKKLNDAIHEGFARAWTSIRDSNLSSIITAVILFWFASTSVIKGFALVFGLGVVTSMFTAITVSRTLLIALGVSEYHGVYKFLFGTGFLNKGHTPESLSGIKK